MNLSELKNSGKEVKEVTPEEMGFKPKEPEHVDNRMDDEKALDIFEKVVIPRKQREMQIFNDLMEENDGNISKKDINEAMGLGFVNDELYKDEAAPLNTKPLKKVMNARKQKGITTGEEDIEEYNFDPDKDKEEEPVTAISDIEDEEDDMENDAGVLYTGEDEYHDNVISINNKDDETISDRTNEEESKEE